MEKDRRYSPTVFLVGLLVFSLLSVPVTQAEGPDNVQFVGLNALTYSGVDDSGELSSNLTVRQGDHLNLEIPVENTGVDAEIASVVLHVNQTAWNETVYFDNISIDAMSTQVLVYQSSNQVNEGSLNVAMSINNTSLVLNDSILIGPPPLPNVHVEIELITDSYVSGDLIELNLTSSNDDGERSFAGNMLCFFLQEEVYNQSLSVDVGQSVVDSVSLYARPGILECHLDGDRNQSSQTTASFSLEGLPSAVFDQAGSSGFSLIGGPWHAGDDVEVSFILRNQGDATGSALLRVVHDGVEFESESLVLESGAAGELRLVFENLDSGIHNMSWTIASNNGIVSEGLAGIVSIEVQPPQAMFAEVQAEEGDSGVELHWNVSITNGVERDVKLRYGYRVSGTDVYVNEQILTLGSGTLSGQTVLGEIQGDTVLIRMEPVDWTASTSSYIATSMLETVEAEYSLQINPITLPREPVEGEVVTVTIMIQNTGPVAGPSGFLYLTDSSGLLLGQLPTEPLQASSSRNLDLTFVVPNGNEMILDAEWRYDGIVVMDEQSILVSPRVVEDAASDVPFVAIGGGAAVACCIILVLHLRRGTGQLDSMKPVKEKKAQPKPEKKVEPIETSCPACDRTLRIPGDYSGVVRCPDCSEKFTVEAQESLDIDEELDAIEDVEPEQETTQTKVEIACPKCSSKLRVPSSYKGSVRCPTCSHVFSAS